jgi:hypothetical protein
MRISAALLAVLMSISVNALADDEDVQPVSDAPDGQNSVMRGVQGAKGLFSARVLLHINMSKDAIGEPVSLAPDLYYSLSDRFQLGLLHNGPMGFQTRPGAGICFTGKDHGCAKVYNNIGFDALYGLAFGKVHFSAHASLYVTQFSDPTHVMLTLGGAGKVHFSDGLALFFDPQIGIALSDRDGTNEDALFLPLELQFQLSPPVALKLLTGISGPLDGFGDAYQIPVGLGAVYNLSPQFDLGLRFSFDNLLGKVPDGVGRADARSIALLLHFRG